MEPSRKAGSAALLAASLGATSGFALGATTAVGTADVAHSYPVGQLPTACGSPTTYSFDGSWTTTKKNSVRTGINQWGQVETLTGGTMVIANESPATTGTISVTWDTTVDPAYARASCSSGYMRFNPFEWPGTSTFGLSAIAAHEMGHIWGLGHVGRADSPMDECTGPSCAWIMTAPRMATCLADLNDFQNNAAFTADDYAALTSRHEGNGIPSGSFETPDLRNWKLHNATESRVAVPSVGSYARRYLAADWLDNYIGQRHTLWFQTSSNLTFVFDHRAAASGTTGDIVGQILTREYSYGMGGSPCVYPSSTASVPNMDANSRTTPGLPLVLRGSTAQATTTSYQTNVVYASNLPRGNAGSHEFEVRIISNAKTASMQTAPVYIDAAWLTD